MRSAVAAKRRSNARRDGREVNAANFSGKAPDLCPDFQGGVGAGFIYVNGFGGEHFGSLHDADQLFLVHAVTLQHGVHVHFRSAAEHPHYHFVRSHFHGEDSHFFAHVHRSVGSYIQCQGGFTHGGTRGDDDELAGSETSGEAVKVAVAAWNSNHRNLLCSNGVYGLQHLVADLVKTLEANLVGEFGYLENCLLGFVNDVFHLIPLHPMLL